MPEEPIIREKTLIQWETEIRDLRRTLEDRDKLIKTLSDEKVSAINEKNNLLNDLEQKNSEISSLKADKLSLEQNYEGKLKIAIDSALQKDLEIAKLNSRIIELSQQGVTDKTLIADVESLHLKYEAIKKEAMIKDIELVGKRAELNRLTAEKENLTRDYAALKETYLREQQEKNRYMQELSIINEKLMNSFTLDQMSNYFAEAIDSFNKNANSTNQSLDYVINEMDVELKTALSKNDTNEMVMTAPNIVNENAYSTVKFSIRAVPKGVYPNK